MVRIGQYKFGSNIMSRSVNISLDGLNIKKVLANIGKVWLILVKMLAEGYWY